MFVDKWDNIYLKWIMQVGKWVSEFDIGTSSLYR
jgi:hypothetical protein